jgi:hypothetical protein
MTHGPSSCSAPPPGLRLGKLRTSSCGPKNRAGEPGPPRDRYSRRQGLEISKRRIAKTEFENFLSRTTGPVFCSQNPSTRVALGWLKFMARLLTSTVQSKLCSISEIGLKLRSRTPICSYLPPPKVRALQPPRRMPLHFVKIKKRLP